MILHLTAAPDDKALLCIIYAVTGTAGQGQLLQNVDMFPFHLPVSHQETGGCQGSQTGTYQICGFAVNTFGFYGTCECFIIAIAVIHMNTSLFIGIIICFFICFYYKRGEKRLLYTENAQCQKFRHCA